MSTQSTRHSAEIVQGLDDPRLLAALEANTYAAYIDYASNPDSWVDDTPNKLSFISGIPEALFNGIARARLNPDDIDTQISAALRPFRERGVPMYWWISSTTGPLSLGGRLLANGLAYDGGMPGMAVELEMIGRPEDVSSAFVVEPVMSAEVADEWSEAVQVGNEAPPELRPALREMFTRLCLRREPRWTSFLGRVNGRAVATAQLFIHDGVAGVYCVSTAPDARRHGYGAEVTRSALRYARGLGYRAAILQSSAMGLPIYEKMGFRTLMRFEWYLLPGAESQQSTD